jgi:hypothetical protein
MSWIITPQTKVPVDPNISQVSLLLHGNGANGSTTITDSSPSPQTISRFGDTQISTAQSKFGGASIAFDGTGDYLTVPVNSNTTFGSGNFTIEFWIWFNSPSILYRFLSWGTNSSFYGTRLEGSGGNLSLYMSTTGTSFDITANMSSVYTNQVWYHFALVRNGNNINFYKDGTNIYSGSLSGSLIDGLYNTIGGLVPYNIDNLNGYIDDLRITKGVARYTANFTPPAAPFPDI